MNGYAFFAGWLAFALVNNLVIMPEFKWSFFIPNVVVGMIVAGIMIYLHKRKLKQIEEIYGKRD